MKKQISISTVEKIGQIFNFINETAPSLLPAFSTGADYKIVARDVCTRTLFGGPSVIFILSVTTSSGSWGFQCVGGQFQIGGTVEQWTARLCEAMAELSLKMTTKK